MFKIRVFHWNVPLLFSFIWRKIFAIHRLPVSGGWIIRVAIVEGLPSEYRLICAV
jgi:hypothetical protein